MPDYRGKFISDISEESTFLENWEGIRSLDLLYIPIGDGNFVAIDPSDSRELHDFLDVAGTTSPDGLEVAFVLTDPSLVPVDLALAKLPVSEVLFRLFRNSRLDGVIFNPPVADSLASSTQGFTLFSFALPRLIGLKKSENHLARNTTHLELCKELLEQDKICEAMYHSAQSRDVGEDLDQAYFYESLCLLRLSLAEQAQSYLDWYEQQGGTSVLTHLIEGQLALFKGQFDLAKNRIEPFLLHQEYSHIARLEMARICYMNDDFDQSCKYFEQALTENPDDIEARLGLGVTLRTMHYEPINESGLLEAKEHFEFVVQNGNFHRAEGLHHLGTILSALEEWQEAEQVYQQTLELSPSPVSKRNLCLVLHALGKRDEGLLHYLFLKEHFSEYAAGLEQYFEPKTFLSYTPEPRDIEAEIDAYLLAARADIEHEFDLPFKGDLLDFKRFDEYINHYAPGGVFLDGSHFFEFEWPAIENAMESVALYLADILVRSEMGCWDYSGGEEIPYAMVRLNTNGSDEPVSLLGNVLRKLQAGAINDNITSLETLIALAPDYRDLLSNHSPCYTLRPLGASSVKDQLEQGLLAVSTLRQAGFLLCEDISDLGMLDAALSSLKDPRGPLTDRFDTPEDTLQFLHGIGYYFGNLVRKYAGGEWFDHPDSLGLSVRESELPDIYPLWVIYRRVEVGSAADMFESLTSFKSPLVCASLARRLEAHEILTRTELSNLLAEYLPKIMQEDPSGGSLGRMVDMISMQAIGKILD